MHAILVCMQWVLGIEIYNLIIENDSLMAIRYILEGNKCLAIEVNLVKDIVELVKKFAWSECQFRKRKANKAAHYLTKYAINNFNCN